MHKVGFSTIGCPDYEIDQVISLATCNGFEGLEFRFLRGTTDLLSLPEFSPTGIADTRSRLDDAGLKVVGVSTSVRMASLDSGIREQQKELAKANLAIALALGASYMRVFGGPIPEGQDKEKTLDAIAAGLGDIADMTASCGVTSLIETHDEFCTADSIIDLYSRGAGDNLDVLWDTLHSYRHGEAGETTWSGLSDRIRLVHVKDSYTATPECFDCALTGEGTVPVTSFLDILARDNYEGFINFEWERGWHPEIEGPEIAMPHFARFMAEYRQGV